MTAHSHAEHVAGCFRCDLSREESTPTTGEVRADTLRAAARDIPSAYQHGDSPSAWLTRRADQLEEA